MQDRYSGDVGDFGKFHLLRFLLNNQEYNLSQIWYMYPDETHNNDGLYINYFEKVKKFDYELEEKLLEITQTNRCVKALEESKLVKNTKYFSLYVNENAKDDLVYRKAWFQKALKFSENSDFIAVDPDNGVATKLIKKDETKDIKIQSFEDFKTKSKAGKYIFDEEIKHLYKNCKCLIIYHHLNRTMSHDKQIEILKSKFEKEYKKVFAIKHKPYSPRVFFFLCSCDEVASFLEKRLKEFENSFSIHWKLFDTIKVL
ncbi:hypothetical protein ACH5BF_01380 [Arcobacter sp. YIC-464]|uniref:hypothetical protein n=1 Tax=Arcobacter sp. YIC-464 TaxID=3376631 RepID=UPI003C25F6F8